MKRILIFLFAVFLTFSFLPSVYGAPTEVTFSVMDSTTPDRSWLDSSNPTTTHAAGTNNVYIGNDTGTRNYSTMEKFNITSFSLPVGKAIISARINIKIVNADYTTPNAFTNITIWGVDNQTWIDETMNYNEAYHFWTGAANNVTLVGWNDTFRPYKMMNGSNYIVDVTNWFKWMYNQSRANITFWMNHTVNSTGNNAFGYITILPEYLNVFFDDTPPSLTGLNLSLKNAWNSSDVSAFTVFYINTTVYSSQTTATNNITILSNNISGTNVTIIVSKSGYVNISYIGLSLNSTTLLDFEAKIAQENDIIHVVSPANTTYYGSSVLVSLATPSAYGDMFSIFYNLGATNYSLNTSSSQYSGYITASFSTNNMIIYISNTTSQFWNNREFNITISFSSVYSLYNINIRDEMSGNWLSLSGTNTTLTVFCPTYINITQLTSSATINFSTNCENPELKLQINTSTQTQYRTLLPESGISNLTFFMINLSTHTPVFSRIVIEDLSSQFSDSKITLYKAVPNYNSQTINEQNTDSEAKILTYLIDGETYQVVIDNGMETRSVGLIKVSSASNIITIKISEISLFPTASSQWNTIYYSFFYTPSSNYTAVQWEDRSNKTTSIYMVVYNASNYSQIFYLSPTVYGSNDTLISWSSVPVNTSIRVKFVAQHETYGEITESRTFSPAMRLIDLGLPSSWYEPIAIFMLITFVMLFSVWDAHIGSIIALLFAGMFWFWGWLPLNYAGAVGFLVFIVFANALRSGER